MGRYSLILPIVAVSLFDFTGRVLASYCGQAAIPYSLEILRNDQPVLGCARPACFGWTANGGRVSDPAQFYRVNGQADGFLRAGDSKKPVTRNVSVFQPQYSICDRSYLSNKCAEDSWVGGISPSQKIKSGDALRLMCCHYNKLRDAANSGNVELHAGKIVEGGEVRNANGRTIAFEYIANIQRLFDYSGNVFYVATMRKFACMPEPPASPVVKDVDAAKFLIDNILQSTMPTMSTSRRFTEQKSMLEENSESATFSSQQAKNINGGKFVGVPFAKSMDDENDVVEEATTSPPEQAMQYQRYNNQRHTMLVQDNDVLEPDYASGFIHSQQKQQQTRHQQKQHQTTQPPHYNNEQIQQNSIFNPLGLIGGSPQWITPLQQQPLFNKNFVLHQQQVSTQNLNPFALGGFAGSELTQELPKMPLIEIPAPEDLDNMIPPNSRKLIENMAKTLLSYFQ